MKEQFENFGRSAGAKLNVRKTISIDVGYINNNNRLAVPWLQTADKVKILGIVFVNSVRLMGKLNWVPLVGMLTRQLWLHRMRTLTLQQKVVLLNTFITSKLWYVASVLAITKADVARLTRLMGSFLWAGQCIRVPMQQLALPVELGGLNLHLPAFKCQALLVNRHLREIENLPFYNSFVSTTRNPPNLRIVPTNCPCLKTVCSELPYLPSALQANPSANLLHAHYLNKIDKPKVVLENPTANWNRIWRNIAAKHLTSLERCHYYLLVNRKLSNQRLLHRMQRADSDMCPNCNNEPEDIPHKISTCPRVAAAWTVLQRRLRNIAQNRNISLTHLLQPTLFAIRRSVKVKVLKTFIQFVIFVSKDNNVIDINELEFHLDTEV